MSYLNFVDISDRIPTKKTKTFEVQNKSGQVLLKQNIGMVLVHGLLVKSLMVMSLLAEQLQVTQLEPIHSRRIS